MSKSLVVYPYKMSSKSAKLLSSVLDCKRIYPNKEYIPTSRDVIINWGNGHCPTWIPLFRNQVINHWKNICYAIDKSKSFDLFKQHNVVMPKVTQSSQEAKSWLADGDYVVGRQYLEGKDGEGIILMKKPSDFRTCELYTRYEKKITEYRVYTMGDKVIDCLEKRRDVDFLREGKVDEFIRTEKNGWVFCRQRVTIPPEVGKQSIKAVKALGLVFGGVDVIWNPHHGRACVLEVNTAPSIFGETVHRYAEALTAYAEKI